MLFIHPLFYLYFQVLIKLFEKYSNLFYAVLIAQFRIKITRRRHLLGDSENTPYPADAQCESTVTGCASGHIPLAYDGIRLIWRAQLQQHNAARLVCESVLAGFIHLAEQLTGRLIPVMEVCFVHPSPSDYRALEYQQGFRAQCKFSQSHNSITMAADVLSWPLQHIARPSVTGTDSGQVVEQVKNQLKKA